MNTVPQIEPVSKLVKDHKAIFARLDSGPVILANRSQPQAVIISIDEWDRIAKELNRYRIMAEGRRIIERNDANDSWTSFEDLLDELEKKHDAELIAQIRAELSNNVAR